MHDLFTKKNSEHSISKTKHVNQNGKIRKEKLIKNAGVSAFDEELQVDRKSHCCLQLPTSKNNNEKHNLITKHINFNFSTIVSRRMFGLSAELLTKVSKLATVRGLVS